MNKILATEQQKLQQELGTRNHIDSLYYCLDKFGDRIAFASSLGLEDQVLTDMILSYKPNARIFTLDTGRLYRETYDLIENINTTYATRIEVFFPQASAVEKLVSKKGMFSFLESIENRKECCAIRKLEPLSRALEGLDIWITGIRSQQSLTRVDMKFLECDDAHHVLKINPLIDWSEDHIWDYIRSNNVPYNVLHDQGFPSIGCAPCTRAVQEGEDIRSGRWWWEHPEHKECGLHRNS